MTIQNQLIGAAGALALGLGALSGSASAEDRKWTFSFSATGTSDYIFRGVSQTNEDPAFQASVDVGYGIFYLGAWGSGVDQDFVGGASAEIDIYAGITPSLGIVDFDFGIIYYAYPNQDDARAVNAGQVVDVDYVEFKAGVSTDDLIKNLTLGVTGYYSPDYTFEQGEVGVVEGSLSYALPSMGPFSPSITGLIGYLAGDLSDNFFALDAGGTDDDYWYWNAGLEVAIEKFTLDFRYHDTDIDDSAGAPLAGIADERFVFTGTFTY